MTRQHINQHPATTYLLSASPSEGLKHVGFRCEQAIELLNRAKIAPSLRKELIATWRYAYSLVRLLETRWRIAQTQEDREALRHMHYVMLPAIITENVPWTSFQLFLYCPQERLRQDWRDIWSAIDTNNPIFATA